MPDSVESMSGGASVEEQISAWSSTRAGWQQRVLGKIARGEAFDQVKLEEIADQLIDRTDQSSNPLDAEDVLSTLGSTPTVTLRSIREALNVNALLDAEELTFGMSNLTIVYGDNASGKSGYARILKSVAGSLHQEPVHTNVFSSGADQEQSAEVAFESDGKERDSTWPHEVSEDLQGIRFYDRACDDIYISTDSELTYRPSALVLLDRLVYVCDGVRSILEDRLITRSVGDRLECAV